MVYINSVLDNCRVFVYNTIAIVCFGAYVPVYTVARIIVMRSEIYYGRVHNRV